MTFQFYYFLTLSPKYSSLDKKGMELTWRTNCHVVRVTVMDDHGKGVIGLWQSKEFRNDWFDRIWTIDSREDGNIWDPVIIDQDGTL